MSSLEEFRTTLERLFKDQILNILVKNSNLTEIQLETFIIDFLFEISYLEKVNYDLKGFIRSKRVTRGSFHRTLQQARKNIISALFTILLLIYIGILNEATINEFKLLVDRLKEYLSSAKTLNPTSQREVEEELQKGLKKLIESRKV